MSRKYARWLSLIILSATLSPILENWRDSPEDSFPFSYYPMFSFDRGEHTVVVFAIAIDSRRHVRPVPYRVIGRGGLNSVLHQLERIALEGGPKLKRLCRRIARRLVGLKEWSDTAKVRIVSGRFDRDAFFSGDRRPDESHVFVSCRP